MTKQNYLTNIASSKLLYFAMTILLTGKSLPTDSKFFAKAFFSPFKRDITWKVESHYQKKLSASMLKKQAGSKLDLAKRAKEAKNSLDRAIQSAFKGNSEEPQISVA